MTAVPETLLASQPIYDRERQLFGCELLFRSDKKLTVEDIGEDRATSEVLVNYCSSIMEQADLLQRPVFINLTESLLLSEAFFPIEPDKVVLELVERTRITPAVVSAVKQWRQEGFRFAFDDFDGSPQWAPLLEMAEFIKLDVMGQDPETIIHKKSKIPGSGIKWVAERIETAEEFQRYHEAGFDLFQGYFLARPKTILGKTIRSDQSSALDIIRAVNDPDLSMDELSAVISKDPRLVMQLLRIVNSPACSLNREIQSIKEAVIYLGLDQVRKWAIILSLLAAKRCGPESCRLILIRAKAMETWCHTGPQAKDSATAFMVGLLSGVDLLLEIEPDAFLQQLRLAPVITSAILKEEGALGRLLGATRALELDLMTQPDRLTRHNGSLLSSYSAATGWAESTMRAMLQTG